MMADTLTIEQPKVFDLLPQGDTPVLSGTTDRPQAVAVDAEGSEVREEPKEAAEQAAEDKEKAAEDAKAEGEKTPEQKAHKTDETPPIEKAYITREKNRRKAVEEENSRLKDQLDQALKLAQQYAPKPVADKPAPSREQYDDPDAYIDAVAEWKAGQMVKAWEAQQAENAAKVAAMTVQQAHAERMSKAAERLPEIADLAKDPTLPINESMADAIMRSEVGPDVLAWINDHREEGQRIYNLPPSRAAAEIGKIEAQLAAPKAASVSRAPRPITPVGGRNNVQRNIGEMTSAEWEAHMDSQRAEKVAALRGIVRS